MKKYIKNKDFIPERFYDLKELNNKKSEKRIFCILMITNLLFLPITADYILKIKEKPVENVESINKVKENKININDINIWIEIISKDNIEEAHVKGGNGELMVKEVDTINELSSNNLMRINDIDLNNNDRYKIGVSLND